MFTPGAYSIGKIPNRVTTPKKELVGARLEFETLTGPGGTPQGMSGTTEQLGEYLASLAADAAYQDLTLPLAQALSLADPPAVSPNTLYGIRGDWNAVGEDTSVYLHGVKPTAYHRLGVVYDAQGAGELVEVDVRLGTYEPFSAGAAPASTKVDFVNQDIVKLAHGHALPPRVTVFDADGYELLCQQRVLGPGLLEFQFNSPESGFIIY